MADKPLRRLTGLANRSLFRTRILRWYDRNKRDLPWRKDRDPYRVWISEIMLQQTRVAAVTDYYRRFLQLFPTIHSLASARESQVLAVWSGLGYYRRARMIHAAAKEIVAQRDGNFPTTAEQLITLPGIGRYTSAAIASIAFDEPVAVVDGNVQRILSRLSGNNLSSGSAWNLAEQLLSPRHPGDFNQSVMELGAVICTPKSPLCAGCPVFDFCKTRGELKQVKRSARQKRIIRYALCDRKGAVLLVQRSNQISLMPGMWELPTLPTSASTPAFSLRHSITVTDYEVHVERWERSASGILGVWVPRAKLTGLPLTGLARKILRLADQQEKDRHMRERNLNKKIAS
jgi:A/G-specific adenine glycosylase